MNLEKPRVVELFAGVGGFRKAIEKVFPKAEFVFVSEWDKFAAKSYEALFNEKPEGDITKFKAKDIPDHDILVGGFPCQSFSIAGCQLGFEDTRGTLFFDMLRIAKEKQPSWVIMENVKGLLGHKKGETISTMIKLLSDIGYKVDFTLLNSKNFGVPQNRERTFIVATRIDIPTTAWKRDKVNLVQKRKENLWEEFDNLNTFNFHWKYSNNNSKKVLKDILFTEEDIVHKYQLEEYRQVLLQEKLEQEIQKINKDNDIHRVEMKLPVRKRKYDVDVTKLQELLRYAKKKSKKTNKQVATELNVPLTTVEHWFRTDSSFSIPDATIWFKLKQSLNIQTNYFDDSITEFIIVEGVFEKSNRFYYETGIAPTLTASSTKQEKIIQKIKDKYVMRYLSPYESWALQGYSSEDVDKCLKAGVTETQMHKQAGNGISIPVVIEIISSIKKLELDLNKY